MPSERGDVVAAAEGGSKELRLAVVCYGGVSLAVYMHGLTKEIHKLALASRTVGTVLQLLQDRRSWRVEWYIVILIMVEILLTLYELFFHF